MKQVDSIKSIIIRYLILLIIPLENLFIFYLIFTPLTIYSVYFISKLFSNSTILVQNYILIQEKPFQIVSACIAGSAYYLLLILNLSTPKINIKTRLKSILFSFTLLLILNIARILVLILIFFHSPDVFITTHKILWYFLSTIFVVSIWLLTIKLFNISSIPIYSDIKFLTQVSRKNY